MRFALGIIPLFGLLAATALLLRVGRYEKELRLVAENDRAGPAPLPAATH